MTITDLESLALLAKLREKFNMVEQAPIEDIDNQAQIISYLKYGCEYIIMKQELSMTDS